MRPLRFVLMLTVFSMPLLAQTLNRHTTPGAVLTSDTAVICRPGYAKSVRAVSIPLKQSIYASYHATRRAGHCCEVDHLIALELGGSNARSNLWPMPYPAAYSKDSTENMARKLVCSGKMSLPIVQAQMAKDWRVLYRQFQKKSKP